MLFLFGFACFLFTYLFTTDPRFLAYPTTSLTLYRGTLHGAASSRRRVDRDRDFLGSISTRGGASIASDMDFSLLGGNSTANSSSPLTLSTEDLSISGKVNANASATSTIKEENQESSYHEQEHKQT